MGANINNLCVFNFNTVLLVHCCYIGFLVQFQCSLRVDIALYSLKLVKVSIMVQRLVHFWLMFNVSQRRMCILLLLDENFMNNLCLCLGCFVLFCTYGHSLIPTLKLLKNLFLSPFYYLFPLVTDQMRLFVQVYFSVFYFQPFISIMLYCYYK